MANHRSDPTANAAMGSVDREIRAKRKEARFAARMIRSGELTAQQEEILRRRFTGVFQRFLKKALEETA